MSRLVEESWRRWSETKSTKVFCLANKMKSFGKYLQWASMSDWALKYITLAQNRTNPGKMYWNLIWKSPRFFPFGSKWVNCLHSSSCVLEVIYGEGSPGNMGGDIYLFSLRFVEWYTSYFLVISIKWYFGKNMCNLTQLYYT